MLFMVYFHLHKQIYIHGTLEEHLVMLKNNDHVQNICGTMHEQPLCRCCKKKLLCGDF
jgi:recombinational DNA repair protein RecR